MSLRIVENIASGLDRVWEVDPVIVDVATEFQNVVIGDTEQGRSLFCNNERESTVQTQLIYHEGQIVPAMLLHPFAKSALVLGSSEGVVPQMLAAQELEVIKHIDLDPECVALCAEHLPYGYTPGELAKIQQQKDFRIRFRTYDAFAYIQSIDTKYDIICSDLVDMSISEEGQQDRLYSKEFFENVLKTLTDDGVFVTQAGCPSVWRNKNLIRTFYSMAEVFPQVVYFDLEEQDWAWVLGIPRAGCNIEDIMVKNLPNLKVTPTHIDPWTIEKGLIPPISIREKRI